MNGFSNLENLSRKSLSPLISSAEETLADFDFIMKKFNDELTTYINKIIAFRRETEIKYHKSFVDELSLDFTSE